MGGRWYFYKIFPTEFVRFLILFVATFVAEFKWRGKFTVHITVHITVNPKEMENLLSGLSPKMCSRCKSVKPGEWK